MDKAKKPNFIVIGSMKSGTTTLCHLLGQHPDVFMANTKEPEFFCKDDIYERGWEWYLSLFSGTQNESAIGEGSTSYTKAPLFSNAPERIFKHLPHARLIYIVRHPLERIESHWMHRVQHGDARTFKKMFQEYPNLIDTSRYWSQIQRYRKYFRDAQILVLFFEELKKDPEGVIKKCFTHLGVDPDVRLSNPSERRNVTRQFKVESGLLQHFRGSSTFDLTSRILPRSLKSFLKEKLEIRVGPRPVWTEAMSQKAIGEIEDEMQTFLAFYGKPLDFWNLNSRQ